MGYYDDLDLSNVEDELDQMAMPPQPTISADPVSAPGTPVPGAAAPLSREEAVKQAILASQGNGQSDLDKIRMQRNQDVALADVAQGITQLGAGIAGQKADTSIFQAGRNEAQTRAEEAAADSDRRRKAVTDAIRQQQIGDWHNLVHSDKLRGQDMSDERSKRTAGNVDKLTAYRDKRLANQNINAANRIMNDPNAKREVQKLNAAAGAQALVNEIRSGNLKDSSNIAKQLTNLIATIEMGSPGGVQDRQAMGVDTMYTRAQKLLSFVSGNPQSAIPAPYLDQLEQEVKALGHRAAKNYKTVTDAAMSGADLSGGDPNVDVGQVATLMKQRQRQQLKASGFDPETGEPVASQAATSGGSMNDRQKRIAQLRAKKAAGTLGTK